ncbi:large-conductance mechanosensitive channel protein MscL [Lactiplantibacillus mudanjiangensis]|uniref:Large-conductance mechanosensitive channel n=1 Tax=Lactiplantibacillus mudanjiangensis TaxID=1296538 RepID=A0A660DZX7_9LACO|nr:large-conductance mechanosensitive channel protein MscL [Lactiplantibacillus mudanjiangensis]VDG18508.1 large conductance mechanosensitive channel protein MscL [Lactobacillus sp.] [Lactiplantibacillus mudanjiangensis]VDG25901.1 large conductance mechanosensitive channel protein MscL [Lactobacillus sp.] [Lactiplantibacillus mudanjiangensis]VDG28664.1 large conductance mechanosensitive channel protein MscL [Lactobacillus sp.] [Lactiplantibacillus mudanjiangensis]VDG33734.1 large conductance me
MIEEFKTFIARGNVIDLAVGVIIGSAFTGIVKSLTNNLINPLIGIFLGQIDLSNLKVSIGDATFKYGAFINSIINFFIIAIVVFLLVKVINKIVRKEPEVEEEPTPDLSEQYLSEIRDLLKEQAKKQ